MIEKWFDHHFSGLFTKIYKILAQLIIKGTALYDYQGDFHNLYVTFDGASEFPTFEAVSCTGNDKNRYFTQKKHKNAN